MLSPQPSLCRPPCVQVYLGPEPHKTGAAFLQTMPCRPVVHGIVTSGTPDKSLHATALKFNKREKSSFSGIQTGPLGGYAGGLEAPPTPPLDGAVRLTGFPFST